VIRFVLASGSPARLATLRAAGVEPEVVVSSVDESAVTASDVPALAGTLAVAKAEDVAATVTGEALVLGCDSVLEVDGVGYGKPLTPERATERWRQLRGAVGLLHTGHSLLQIADGNPLRRADAVGTTSVAFAEITDAELEDYVASGEPLNVAGGFTIDGRGGWYVQTVQGDGHNVVGLSLPLLRDLLAELGFAPIDLPRRSLR
jgi:septum formation protein